MQGFEYYTPTKVVFGKDTENRTGELVKEQKGTKVLVHYGTGSVKKSGLLDRVLASLDREGIAHVELGGAVPNPRLSLVYQGIELCKKEGVDFILAVGGGSAIDSAKAIAYGVKYDGDVWDFYAKKAFPKDAAPVGVVLTLAATGSEMSNSSVITNEDGWLKRGCNCDLSRPRFAVMNPELTYTLPEYQTMSGCVDIMMHTLERYFSRTRDTELTDRIAEALLKSTVEAGRIADKEPDNYEARAALMWGGSLSHNGLTGAGRDFFMQVHQLEHELSGMYPSIAHGAGLAALWPSWARFVCPGDVNRFARYAVRVWNIDMDFDCPMNTALAGIRATEDFYKSLGMPSSLKELGVEEERLEEMAEKCTNMGKRTLPGIRELGKEEMMEIYRMAMGE